MAKATVESTFARAMMGDVGAEIRRRRALRGLSQREAAGLADVALNTWAAVERGTTKPRDGTLESIAAVLETSVEALHGDGDEADHLGDVMPTVVKLMQLTPQDRQAVNSLIDRLVYLEQLETQLGEIVATR